MTYLIIGARETQGRDVGRGNEPLGGVGKETRELRCGDSHSWGVDDCEGRGRSDGGLRWFILYCALGKAFYKGYAARLFGWRVLFGPPPWSPRPAGRSVLVVGIPLCMTPFGPLGATLVWSPLFVVEPVPDQARYAAELPVVADGDSSFRLLPQPRAKEHESVRWTGNMPLLALARVRRASGCGVIGVGRSKSGWRDVGGRRSRRSGGWRSVRVDAGMQCWFDRSVEAIIFLAVCKQRLEMDPQHQRAGKHTYKKGDVV